MFRHSWGGDKARIHTDVGKEHGREEDDPSTSYTLVEDDSGPVSRSRSGDLRRAGSSMPMLESTSFRNIPLMQDRHSNRVVPLVDALSPVRDGHDHDVTTRQVSEPGPPPSSSVPSLDCSFQFPKVKTSRPEHQCISVPPVVPSSIASGGTMSPSAPSPSSYPASTLVIAYQPLNRSV
ncbi:hypothetical protein DYB37_014009 [Aphanomyces astaci]|uniref:Uncharacterized protein n=1 Tax=Aphanomyces astaci TaxID=112090 RepID=A0A3R7A3E8_APHAT|nr:hypothetical protein DYB35_014045 [Aphanomyces astaci]RHZ09922.1 hypothetical protein DYB37_014009 [Aphanomyces astaci]